MKYLYLTFLLSLLSSSAFAVDTVRETDFSFDRIKESNPGMWQNFYDEKRPFGKVYCYQNDFSNFVADAVTVTESGTAVQQTQTFKDERNGIFVLSSGTSENDGSQFQLGGTGDSETLGESFAPAASKNLWFETRVKSSDANQNDFFVGLHVQDTSVVASRGSDYIGFSVDDGDANLDVNTSKSSAASQELGIATVADDTYVKLGFKVTGVSKVEFYVDDVLKSTLTSNIPTGLMKLTAGHLTGEAATETLSVDYLVACQDR